MTNKTNQKIYIGFQVLLFLGIVFFTMSHFCKWNFNFLVRNSVDNIFNFSVYFLLSFLPYVIKKLNFEFTDFLVYYFFVALGFHFLGGRALFLYNTKFFSFVIHFVNCFLIGVIIYGLIKHNTTNQSKIFMFIMTVACVALVGMVWEVYEFLVDLLFNQNMQRTIKSNGIARVGKKAIFDTMIDIVMDLSGGVLAGLMSGVKIKNREVYNYVEMQKIQPKKKEFSLIGDKESVIVDENNIFEQVVLSQNKNE